MNRLTFAAAICVVTLSLAGPAGAVPVSESTVEKACGDQIEGGCNDTTCATGCSKMEDGKMYDYGCTFPATPGKTKATCRKIQVRRTLPGTGPKTIIGTNPPLLKAD